MAKLGSSHATRVQEAQAPEQREFTLIDDGLYLARFTKLDVVPAKSEDRFAQWQVRYEVVEDITEGGTGDTFKGQTLMEWLSLSPKDYPVSLLHEWFAAFGVAPDTDTDDVVGSELVLHVGHEVAGFGKRKGQTVNTIVSRHPADFGLEESDAPAQDGGAEEPEGEEPF